MNGINLNFKQPGRTEFGPLGHLHVELMLNAQHLISQVHTNNESMKDAMEKGITMAFEELTAGDNFINYVKEETKKQLAACIHNAIMSWEVRQEIENAIRKAVSGKVTEYAQKVADKLTKDLPNFEV